MMNTIRGHLLIEDSFVDGEITFGKTIEKITPGPVNADAPYVIPGFIDLHIHGSAGFDMTTGNPEDTIGTGTFLPTCGVTTFMPTTLSATPEESVRIIKGMTEGMRALPSCAADAPGLHLEGPFLHPDMMGAQPDFPHPADRAVLEALLDAGPVKIMTLAPEIDPEGILLEGLRAGGVRHQIAHSAATTAQAKKAIIQDGYGITHLYNAMTGTHHRDENGKQAGVIGAALAYAEEAEIIADGVHLSAEALLTAVRAIPKLYIVTDASAGAGAPEGTYTLGGQTITKKHDRTLKPDGGLAASALRMDDALVWLVSLGIDLAKAAVLTSGHAAQVMGWDDRGRLAVGTRGDLLTCDGAGHLQAVYLAGQEIAPRGR
ncbi:MAG: amidohydrolase family protein [Pseudomonadota bacterium]